MKNNTFVAKVDPSIAEKLKADLMEQGFQISTPIYTILSGKKKGITCTLYQSGKLLVQGKEKEDFIKFYLEPNILKKFIYSYPLEYVDQHSHIGIDEAGKGDYFGPLSIAGVYADRDGIAQLLKDGIRDSKSLSDKQITKIAVLIKKNYQSTSVIIKPETYNHLYEKFKNLNSLLAWAHATAIENLYKKTQCLEVTIDQFAHKSVVKKALEQKNLPLKLHQRHRGEEDPVVAAASIIARSNFLEELDLLSKKFEISFPKGASAKVLQQAKKFVQKIGINHLHKVAKIHFKTTNQITV